MTIQPKNPFPPAPAPAPTTPAPRRQFSNREEMNEALQEFAYSWKATDWMPFRDEYASLAYDKSPFLIKEGEVQIDPCHVWEVWTCEGIELWVGRATTFHVGRATIYGPVKRVEVKKPRLNLSDGNGWPELI